MRVWHLHPHVSLVLNHELHAAIGGIYETKEVAGLSQNRSGKGAYPLAARSHGSVSRDTLAGALASVEDPEVRHSQRVGPTSLPLSRERRCGARRPAWACWAGILPPLLIAGNQGAVETGQLGEATPNSRPCDQGSMGLRDVIQSQCSLWYGEPPKWSASRVNVEAEKPAVCRHSPRFGITPDPEVIQECVDCCSVSEQSTRNLPATA